MPLYIRDDEVADLARKVQKVTGTRTVTDAVRRALEHEMARAKAPLRERIRVYQEMVAAAGPADPDFDMKKFTDEMWDDA